MLITTTEPTIEPLLLDQARAHLNMLDDEHDDDVYIASLISAVRELFEYDTSRRLMDQVVEYRLDCFPTKIIGFPTSKVTAVNSIQYYDEDDTLQTLAGSEYYELLAGDYPYIQYIDEWPDTYDRPQAVIIELQVGYADPSEVPFSMQQAMLLMLTHLYENREPYIVGHMTEKVGYAYDYLMSKHRLSFV